MTTSQYYDTVFATMADRQPKRRAESRVGMVVTTLALPPELHRRLQLAAIEEHAAIAELIRDAVEAHLERLERKSGRSKRGR